MVYIATYQHHIALPIHFHSCKKQTITKTEGCENDRIGYFDTKTTGKARKKKRQTHKKSCKVEPKRRRDNGENKKERAELEEEHT